MLFKYNERKYFLTTISCIIKLELNIYFFIDIFLFQFDCDHPNDDERRQCQSSGRGVQTRHTLSLLSPREGLR